MMKEWANNTVAMENIFNEPHFGIRFFRISIELVLSETFSGTLMHQNNNRKRHVTFWGVTKS